MCFGHLEHSKEEKEQTNKQKNRPSGTEGVEREQFSKWESQKNSIHTLTT